MNISRYAVIDRHEGLLILRGAIEEAITGGRKLSGEAPVDRIARGGGASSEGTA